MITTFSINVFCIKVAFKLKEVPPMCFSSQASFISATVLAGIGYSTIKLTKTKRQLLVASVPLIFGVQQFSEGVLWTQIDSGLAPNFVSELCKYIFLMCAQIIWPILVPVSLYIIEKVKWRKWVMLLSLATGFLFMGTILWYYPETNIPITVYDKTLQYGLDYSCDTCKIPFLIAVITPWLVSSAGPFWMMGVALAVMAAIAHYIYYYAFTSVWCFFSAFVSVVLYKAIKDSQP